MEIIDEFFNYFFASDPSRLLRIFWFFFVFEFFRFFLVELTTLLFWKFSQQFKKERLRAARKRLWEERPFISIIVPGKNEGKHIYKLANSLK